MYDGLQFLKADGYNGSEFLEDNLESEDEDLDFEHNRSYGGPTPPSYCPYPGMCSNYEDDRDMCEKCRGF